MRPLQPNTRLVYCTCLVRKLYKQSNKISVLAKTNQHTTFDSVLCCDENNQLEFRKTSLFCLHKQRTKFSFHQCSFHTPFSVYFLGKLHFNKLINKSFSEKHCKNNLLKNLLLFLLNTNSLLFIMLQMVSAMYVSQSDYRNCVTCTALYGYLSATDLF